MRNLKKSMIAALTTTMLMSGISVPAMAADDDGTVTLTIWNNEVMAPGLQDNDVAKVIEERLGIKMDIISGDSQKFSVLLAGGDLPDIVYSNYAQQGVDSASLISSGQLIPLDDLIEEYGPNIKANFPVRLEFSKKYASNGQDKIYYIPVLCYEEDPEHPDISYTIENVGLEVRWDVYRAIGCPEIETTDDFLEVLKEMQDYARENDLADGKQIYAISGWSDWGLWPWWLANARELGWLDLNNNVIVNRETLETDIIYNTDAFWDSLAFYNKAYNMGLVDPEAFTMKNDQFWEKCHNGQVLMTYASWQSENMNKTLVANGHADWGFEKLPHDGYPFISGVNSTNAPLGQGIEYATAITTSCEYPEKAMELIDFCNSEEGARLLYSGEEGVHWQYEDGKLVPTEEMKEKIKTDSSYTTSTGVTLYNKLSGMRDIQVMSDGAPANIFLSNEEKANNMLDIDKDYCEYYSEKLGGEYLYPGMVLNDLKEKGELASQSEYLLFTSLVQNPSDETLNIIDQCNQYMNVQGVKAIMAADEDEFAAVREEAMEQLDAMNLPQATEEMKQLYDEAKAAAEEFSVN
ncbi:MAG: extracellular solute-binding protein [Blautia sp.]|nr:extracellular solute-binding protein [Blautia sp.]